MSNTDATEPSARSRAATVYLVGIPLALIAAEVAWYFRAGFVAWLTASMDNLMNWLGPVLVAPFVYLVFIYLVATARLVRERVRLGRPAPLTPGGQLVFVHGIAPSLGLFGTFLGAMLVCRSLAQKLPGLDLLLGSTVVFLGLSLLSAGTLKLLHDGYRSSLDAAVGFEEEMEVFDEEA